MINKWLVLILLSLASIQFASAENFRTFKDKSGREMEAKLVRLSDSEVSIEQKDGLTTKINISIFSSEDQKYIKNWAKLNLLASGIFEVRFTNEDSKKQKSSSGGIERERYNGAYGIEVTNTSYENIKDIRIEYLVLKFEDALAAQKRSEGDSIRIKGTTHIEYIGGRSSAEAVTKAVPMQETKLEQGYVWTGGGKKTSKDVLEGIWIKMYVGEMMVYEHSRPETMMRREAWGK